LGDDARVRTLLPAIARTAITPFALALPPSPAAALEYPFAIVVRDAATGEPVPCVLLRTVHKVPLRTDVHGVAAFWEPGLMGRDVFFETTGPPFEIAADGFGFRGRTLYTEPGTTAEIEVQVTGVPGPCAPGDGASRLVANGLPEPSSMHSIFVTDAGTGRPLPLAELRIDRDVFISDNAGTIAIIEPDLLGSEQDATLTSHGYDPSEPLRLSLDPGGTTPLTLTRSMAAERLGRLTGGGLFRDSVLLGREVAHPSPLLSGDVLGQDSVHAVPYAGSMFFVWGDTLRPSYPLGHFRTAGALASLARPDDAVVAYDYWVGPDGFSRPIADFVDAGLVWTSGLVTFPEQGKDELVASWANVGEGWSRLGAGMMRWNPTTESFEPLHAFAARLPAEPTGTAFLSGGFLYFTDVGPEDGTPFRVVRVPASLAALADPTTYETFAAVDRDGVLHRDGARPAYTFRPEAAPTLEVPSRHRIDGHVRDPLSGVEADDHIGSVFWNADAGRFVRIFARPFGDDAFLGETWLALGDTPMGPWAYGQKVVTHDDYTFYNPRQHPEWDDGSRVSFEGTYAQTFSGAAVPTPRWDYNQVLYRVDLETLVLPVPVYGRGRATRRDLDDVDDSEPASFFALDRPREGASPLRWTGAACERRELSPDGAGETAFFVLDEPGPLSLPLRAGPWRGDTRTVIAGPGPGDPLGYVWENPIDVAFPVHVFPPPFAVDAGADRCGDSPVTLRAGAGRTDVTFSWRIGDEAWVGDTIVVDSPGLSVVTLTAEADDGTRGEDVVVVSIGDRAGCDCHSNGGIACVALLRLLRGRAGRLQRLSAPRAPDRRSPGRPPPAAR
jgi:hypothetical protein